MEIKYLNQPTDIKMGEVLKNKLSLGFDEVFIISGIAKDSAIEYLLNDMKNAVLSNTKINVLIGVDRKNTSKDSILKMIDAGVNVSISVNDDDNKVETRLYVFESYEGDSFVYMPGGKFSEGGLLSSNTLITEIKYSKEENNEFQKFKYTMQKSMEIFKSVDREDIMLLASKGEISSRITDRKIPSISELYSGKVEVIGGDNTYEEGSLMGLINKDEVDNIDIEFDTGISIRKNVELTQEKESKKDIFVETNKTKKDLDRLLGKEEKPKEDKKVRIVKENTEADYLKMNTLIIEAGKIEKGEIKIPKALSTLIINFIDPSKIDEFMAEVMDSKNGKEMKLNIKVEEGIKGGTSLISSDLQDLDIDEHDIIRMMKTSDKEYRLEIIRQDKQEYNVWESYLTNVIKGTKRRFGII